MAILGTHYTVTSVYHPIVALGMTINEEHLKILSEPVHHMEVKEAIFGIPGSKAPGLDGYNSQFFKDTWEIVGPQVTQAVLELFTHGKLLTILNHTTLTLIPKKTRPTSVVDFRFIACCTVIYK
ncbi:hypothetical protein vseg_007422 [Gypsophila vaccaria]